VEKKSFLWLKRGCFSLVKYLAVASSEEEFNAAKEIAERELGSNEKLVILRHYFYPNFDPTGKKIELKDPEDFLDENDLAEIEGRAGFFVRNWYRFDKEFENKTTFNGISLGFVYENYPFYFFKTTFQLIAALSLLIEEDKPCLVIANKNSVAGMIVKAVARANNFKNLRLLDLHACKKYLKMPNLTWLTANRVGKNLSKIVGRALQERGAGKKRKKVFVRSRGYLGGLEEELRTDPELDIVSLDEFLLKKLLNPLNVASYVSTRLAMRKKFRKVFGECLSRQSFKKRLVFNGINFAKMFETMLPVMIERDWPEFVFLIRTLSGLFSSKRPDAVVVW